LGRSRGGLTTKVHLCCEQGQKPLSMLLTAGHRGDSPQFVAVLEGIRVPRLGRGRPRTRPDRVLADKAYTSRANRAYLRRRGIKATIPSKADQDANRRKKGSHGGRPPTFDPHIYKQRHAVEGSRARPVCGQVSADASVRARAGRRVGEEQRPGWPSGDQAGQQAGGAGLPVHPADHAALVVIFPRLPGRSRSSTLRDRTDWAGAADSYGSRHGSSPVAARRGVPTARRSRVG
jgi:hypothetical protein